MNKRGALNLMYRSNDTQKQFKLSISPTRSEKRYTMPDTAAENRWNHLISAIANRGDKEAFAELFQHFSPQIKAYALSKSGVAGSGEIADEVVQETMIKVWRRASLYNASKANLAAWVFSIARNTRVDILRRHAKHQSGISTDDLWLTAEDTEPFAALQQKRIEESIRGSLSSVSSEQSLMLQKMYIEGKSQSEIATECNIPMGTVKSRVRLAMARLKLILKEQQQ